MAYVFLLHFDQPVCETHPARHYLEYAVNIAHRLNDHGSGDRLRTSGIMYACNERNISYTVARIWCSANRRDEYRLRQLHNNPKLCPICTPDLALRTSFDPNNRKSWRTYRTINPKLARYGDLNTLHPFSYKPKERTRSNGESNRVGGSASNWRNDTQARLTIIDDPITPIVAPAELARWVDQVDSVARAVAAANGVPSTLINFRKIDPPVDNDHTPTGFDDDIPY